MRKYGCFQAIIMSFYSRELYRDVARNWKGGVLLYLLLVLILCWAFLSIGIQKSVNVGYVMFANQFYPQLPEMTITNGQLKTPEKRPYLILDSNKQVIAVIDTSGRYQIDKNKSAYVATKNELISYTKNGIKKSYEYPSGLTVDIKPADLRSHLELFVHWTWMLFLPVFLLFSFIYRLIQSALYAILGEIFVVVARIPLTYGEIFKLTIFAITPSIFIGTVLDWFSISFPHSWLFYFILSMGYLIFGIRANKL